MYISWPWVYDSANFEKKLKKASKFRAERPVVVLQKFETIGAFSKPQQDYLSFDLEDSFFHTNKTAKVMGDFLIDNNYQMVWTNSYFEIHIPEGID